MRRRRRALRPRERQCAAKKVARSLAELYRRVHSLGAQRSWRVGIYLDAFGEVPTEPTIYLLKKLGCTLYVPVVLASSKRLRFVRLTHHPRSTRLRRHALGMKSIHASSHHCVAKLDWLLTPLVAADQYGNRLGMGGGYYDRTLAKHPKKPKRIGLAYDFQVVPRLPAEPWDEKLNMLVTPSGVHYPKADNALQPDSDWAFVD